MHIAPDRALTPLNLNGGFQIPYSSHSFKDDDIDDNSNGSKSSDKFKYATQLDNSLDLNASISQIPFKPKTKIIRELNVQGKGLLHLNLNNYRDLETLNCSYNCIADLEFLNDGYHLTQINMSHNQVRSLTTLENTPLRHLDLSYNLIEGCIDFRELMHGSRDKLGWASLEYLCLTGNKIKELKNIHLLTNLRVLLVDNNNLEKVDNLHLLRYLETVSLMKNFNLPHLELKCLPLMQLKELHIDACKCLREWKICPPHIEVFEICNGAICDIPKWEYFPPNLKILKFQILVDYGNCHQIYIKLSLQFNVWILQIMTYMI
ncbi:Leucine-rich repeat profile [Nakaseomyces glabratus]